LLNKCDELENEDLFAGTIGQRISLLQSLRRVQFLLQHAIVKEFLYFVVHESHRELFHGALELEQTHQTGSLRVVLAQFSSEVDALIADHFGKSAHFELSVSLCSQLIQF